MNFGLFLEKFFNCTAVFMLLVTMKFLSIHYKFQFVVHLEILFQTECVRNEVLRDSFLYILYSSCLCL